MKKTLIFILIPIFLIFYSFCASQTQTIITSFDGVEISLEQKGENNPSIILIHGWSNNRHIWDGQVEHFSNKYRVIALDLPGFGQSGNHRSEWSIASFGKDISTIIKELELKEVVLVGFSLGGPIALETANQLSDQIIGIVLVDNLKDVESQIPPPMAHLIDSMMMDLVMHPSKEKMVAGGFVTKNVDSAYERILGFLEGTSFVGWRETLAANFQWQNKHCIKTIQNVEVPIVAINTDHPPTNIEAFRKYAPDFEVHIIPGVGHVIMWDNPEMFNRLLGENIQKFITE